MTIKNTFNYCWEFIKRYKSFFYVLCFSLFWFLIVHLYVFCHINLNHDGLVEYHQDSNVIRHVVELGRFVLPIFYGAKGFYTNPPVTAIFTFLYLFISSLFVCHIFNFKKPVYIALITGFLSVNITIICQAATYMNGLDANLLALTLAVLAVYIWNRDGDIKTYFSYLFIVPLLIISMGLYQSYVSVAITLIIIKSIYDLLYKRSFKEVLIKGLIGAGLIFISMILYFKFAELIAEIHSVPLEERVNVFELFGGSFFETIGNTYKDWFVSTFLNNTFANQWITFTVHIILVIILLACLFVYLTKKDVNVVSKILSVLLLVVMPLGMNVIYILSNGFVHELTKYSFWLFYLLILVFVENIFATVDFKNQYLLILKYASISIVGIQIVLSSITGYRIYIKKTEESILTAEIMTAIIEEVEATPRYRPGLTTVTFVGSRGFLLSSDDYSDVSEFVGCKWGNSIGAGYPEYFKAYFTYCLPWDVSIADYFFMKKMEENPEFIEMPSYPEPGFIKVISDAVVIKLSPVKF